MSRNSYFSYLGLFFVYNVFVKKSLIIRKSIIIFLLVAIIVTLAILKNNTDLAEGYMRTVGRSWQKMANAIRPNIPISLTEHFYAVLVIGVVFLVVFFIIHLKGKKWNQAFSNITTVAVILLGFFASYSASCELAYNRHEMPLPYYETEVDRTEYVKIYNYFANDVNACIEQLSFTKDGEVKGKMDLDKLSESVIKSYDIVTDPYFHSTFGAVKPMASSPIFREFQITGVDFSPLGKANINILSTQCEMPLVVAHEIAHTKGVMREDDANKLAFYVCLNSEDPYLRYSAYSCYFYQLEYMASGTYLTEEERAELVKIDPVFYQSRKYMNDYWEKHDLLAKIGDYINNLYIKSSGVEEGTSSYSGGTEYHYDPTEHKLVASLYHKLFFARYYAQ